MGWAHPGRLSVNRSWEREKGGGRAEVGRKERKAVQAGVAAQPELSRETFQRRTVSAFFQVAPFLRKKKGCEGCPSLPESATHRGRPHPLSYKPFWD
jgi:hypothetical protein